MQQPKDSPYVAATPNPRLIARWIGAVYVVGAVVTMVWIAIPHPDRTGDNIVFAMAAIALFGGVSLIVGAADDVRPSTFHLVLAAVQVAITVSYAAAPGAANDGRLFYVWVTPIAAFFFRPVAAAAHAALVAVLLAYGLWVHDATFAAAARIWVMTVATVFAVTALVASSAAGVRRRDAAMSHAASHDPLTGLANRGLLEERTAEALTRRHRTHSSVIMLLADLDRFKLLNDTYGHHAGDELLKVLGKRLAQNVPDNALVARLGGDEFAILIEDHSGDLDPMVIAADLARAWAAPVDLERGQVRTSACVGVAVAIGDDDSSTLLRNADAAMYRAKADGRSGICIYDERQRADIHRKMDLEQALFDAISKRQLSIVYQPVIDLVTGRVAAAEALLRWEHPTLGIVHPGEFIPLAEECGIIDQLGLWAMDQALAQLSTWRATGVALADCAMHVNVSGAQLHGDFAGRVARVLDNNAMEPSALMMELTESVLMRAGAEATDVLDAINRMGVLLALDDFGTGYSSLSYLHQAAVHTVKIDQSFVAGMATDPTRQAIVSAVIALTKALGLQVIAEGVDSREQVELLMAMGCQLAQGFLLARPMPPSGMADFLLAAQGRIPAHR